MWLWHPSFLKRRKRSVADEIKRELSRQDRVAQSIRDELVELGEQDSHRFDSAGLSLAREGLAALTRAITMGDAPGAKQCGKSARSTCDRHKELVEKKRSQWLMARTKCSAVLVAVEDAVAGLKVDRVITRWCTTSIDALAGEVSKSRASFEEHRFAEVEVACRDSHKQVERIVAQGQAAQLREERRQYVVSSLCDVLAAQGFALTDGSPALDYPDQPRSATMIQARRVTGESLAISVPHDLSDRIEYDVAGYETKRALSVSGMNTSSCDLAESTLDEARAMLAEEFGIDSTPLQWEGKDPLRIQKGAKGFPGGRDTGQEFGGPHGR